MFHLTCTCFTWRARVSLDVQSTIISFQFRILNWSSTQKYVHCARCMKPNARMFRAVFSVCAQVLAVCLHLLVRKKLYSYTTVELKREGKQTLSRWTHLKVVPFWPRNSLKLQKTAPWHFHWSKITHRRWPLPTRNTEFTRGTKFERSKVYVMIKSCKEEKSPVFCTQFFMSAQFSFFQFPLSAQLMHSPSQQTLEHTQEKTARNIRAFGFMQRVRSYKTVIFIQIHIKIVILRLMVWPDYAEFDIKNRLMKQVLFLRNSLGNTKSMRCLLIGGPPPFIYIVSSFPFLCGLFECCLK